MDLLIRILDKSYPFLELGGNQHTMCGGWDSGPNIWAEILLRLLNIFIP